MTFEINNEKRSTPRRASPIPRLTDHFAYQRVVTLPMDLAIVHSAAQNFRLDLAMGYHADSSAWADIQHSYFQEANGLLSEHGFNMFPGFNDEAWIHAGQLGNFSAHNARSGELVSCYDLAFDHNPEQLIALGCFPNPRQHTCAITIASLYAEIFRRRVMH